ncbi:MAG: hypothetical protein ACYDH9_12195 [Limisphaerales bacterium]
MIRLFTVFLLIATSACAQESARKLSDEEFFGRFLLPAAQRFAKLPGMPFPRGLSTNLITQWKIDRVTGQDVRAIGHISLKNRMFLILLIKDTNCGVFSFNCPKINPNRICTQPDATEAKVLADQRNYFTMESALKFATNFLKAAGHNPENFRLIQAEQYAWGFEQRAAGRRVDHDIQLPFYSFMWRRKDAKAAEPGHEWLLPSITLDVSGLDRTVIDYHTMSLPITGDFEEPATPSRTP